MGLCACERVAIVVIAQVSEWFAQVSEDAFAQVSEDVRDSVSRLRQQKHPR